MKKILISLFAGLFVAGIVAAAETSISSYQLAEHESSMVVASSTLSTAATTSFFVMAPKNKTSITTA